MPAHVGVAQVLVLGSNFRDSSRLACRFGPAGVNSGTTVPVSRYMNSSAIVCVSPPRLAPPGYPAAATVTVEATNNAAIGGGSSSASAFSRSGVLFRYEDAPRIDHVVPHLGPASGNFSVRVAGGPFPSTRRLR